MRMITKGMNPRVNAYISGKAPVLVLYLIYYTSVTLKICPILTLVYQPLYIVMGTWGSITFLHGSDGNRGFTTTHCSTFVTRHEKTGLMYTKYTYSYYSMYLLYCLKFLKSVSCMRFPMNSCIHGVNFIRLL